MKTDKKLNLKYVDSFLRCTKGYIKFRLYQDNVLVFMGSYINTPERGKGYFKEMLRILLDEYSDKDIYVPISNEILIKKFTECGFKIYDNPIRYWNKPENCTNMFKPKNITN